MKFNTPKQKQMKKINRFIADLLHTRTHIEIGMLIQKRNECRKKSKNEHSQQPKLNNTDFRFSPVSTHFVFHQFKMKKNEIKYYHKLLFIIIKSRTNRINVFYVFKVYAVTSKTAHRLHIPKTKDR